MLPLRFSRGKFILLGLEHVVGLWNDARLFLLVTQLLLLLQLPFKKGLCIRLRGVLHHRVLTRVITGLLWHTTGFALIHTSIRRRFTIIRLCNSLRLTGQQ